MPSSTDEIAVLHSSGSVRLRFGRLTPRAP
jgi:hypothetical protein